MNMNGKKATILILLTLGCLIYIWGSLRFPKWVTWENQYISTDSYEIQLKHKKIKIMQENQVVWSTDDKIKVQDILICDIDNDGDNEMVFLGWRKCIYGLSSPFWEDNDTKDWSQHIFVYKFLTSDNYTDKTTSPYIKPYIIEETPQVLSLKWTSSYIGQDVASFNVTNSQNHTHLLLTDTDGIISSWKWDSWGFTKEENTVTFSVFGDNLIHEQIYLYGLNNNENFNFLFTNVKEYISNSDISIINQETPMVDNPNLYHDYPRFGTPLAVGEAIVNAGFDVVTCATNHALDQGNYGINTTKNFFLEHNITCLGIQTENESEYIPYEILEKNGIKFALLNYTYGTNGIKIPEDYPYMVHTLYDKEQVISDITNAKNNSGFVIVLVHWGTENSETIDNFQKEWTDIFLTNKVDVVIGTHTHTMQSYEKLTDSTGHQMLVYYSIGNFISAQSQKECTKGGIATFTVGHTVNGLEILDYDLIPLTIKYDKSSTFTAYPQQ